MFPIVFKIIMSAPIWVSAQPKEVFFSKYTKYQKERSNIAKCKDRIYLIKIWNLD